MKKYSLALSIVLFLVIVFGANLALAENKMESASIENMAYPLPEKRRPYKDETQRERLINDLRKAGMSE